MWKLTLAAIALAFAAAACGAGREAPATCGHASSCGGSIVGDWAFAGSCVNASALAPSYTDGLHTTCAPEVTATDDVTATYVPTTVSFNADGTYAGKFVLTGSIGIRIPIVCLAGTCAELEAQVRAMVAPGGDVAAAYCSGSATSCSCSITRWVVSNQTGTYTADGFDFRTRPNLGPATYAQYCVSGPELHLVTRVPMSHTFDSPLSLASDIVLVRQQIARR